MHVALVGTYPPAPCGIATFTADVEEALQLLRIEVSVVPVESTPERPGIIARDDLASYRQAAEGLNDLTCDVVLIEHEFGIFGGEAGAYLLAFTQALHVPYVVTLHTVLPQFSPAQTAVIKPLLAGAAAVTLFTATARELLIDQHLVEASSVHIVPHGAPVQLYLPADKAAIRRRLGLPATGRVLSTFGLLSVGKGIELALGALNAVVDELPDVRYLVAGRTHPGVLRHEGERYRTSLVALVHELGLEDHVLFLDRFLSLGDLAGLLAITDVFCTPYRGADQIVSGALTFALAAGCPVVSTPYRFATDVLASGAGILVDFDDGAAMADAMLALLTDGPRRRTALAAARAVSASLAWPTVGASISAVLRTATVGLPTSGASQSSPSIAELDQLTVSTPAGPERHNAAIAPFPRRAPRRRRLLRQ